LTDAKQLNLTIIKNYTTEKSNTQTNEYAN